MTGRITNMKALCALMVVAIHVKTAAPVGSLMWYVNCFLNEGLCRVAVPFFFVASGYFLARHFSEVGWWSRELGKRVKSLLVPFLVFNCLAMIVVVCCDSMEVVFHSVFTFLGKAGIRPDMMPALSNLWYLRALFIIVLISPLLAWMARQRECVVLASMLLLAVCVAAFVPFPGCGMCRYSAELRYFFPLEGVLYFMVGVCLRLRLFCGIFDKLKEYLVAKAFLAGGVAIVVGALLLWVRVMFVLTGHRHPAGLAGFAAIPFAMYGVFAMCPRKTVWPRIATLSFPVFLLHRFFVWWFSGSTSGCPQVDSLSSSVWWYVVRVILAASCSVVVALAAKKIFPRFSAVCFGGR